MYLIKQKKVFHGKVWFNGEVDINAIDGKDRQGVHQFSKNTFHDQIRFRV